MKKVLYFISKLVFALGLIFAGVQHFTNFDFYYLIIKDFLIYPEVVVYLSGFLEILFALLLLIPKYSKKAAYLIIVLLLAIFPANIYMYLNSESFAFLSEDFLLYRLPIQFVLIAWVYLYTRDCKK